MDTDQTEYTKYPKLEPIPLVKAVVRWTGNDAIIVISVGVGIYCALAVAESLDKEGVSVGVMDLRTVSPLDEKSL